MYSCTQEEADTRMLLHAAHTADHGVIIKSPDGDVAVIALPVSQHSTDLSHRNAAPHPIPRPHCHRNEDSGIF